VPQPSASWDHWRSAHWTIQFVDSASCPPGKWIELRRSAARLTQQSRKSFAYIQVVAFRSTIYISKLTFTFFSHSDLWHLFEARARIVFDKSKDFFGVVPGREVVCPKLTITGFYDWFRQVYELCHVSSLSMKRNLETTRCISRTNSAIRTCQRDANWRQVSPTNRVSDMTMPATRQEMSGLVT